MSKKRNSRTQGPLGRLESLVKEAGIRLKREESPCPAVPAKDIVDNAGPCSDDDAFLNEMKGVRRVSWRHTPLEAKPPPPKPVRDQGLLEHELMKAALAGEPALAITEHPEYIEGWLGIDGMRYLPHLRNGLYSIQSYLDLHGLTREEARKEVEDFIVRMSRFRPCCVKIIHGRGLNSPNDKAVLKESLQEWLSTRRMSRRVIAYASASLADGGVGATYVLLRSAKG